MIDIERTGDVFLLKMDGGENRMNPAWLGAMNAALDEVDAAEGPKALVSTGAGKFFSNGLDLDPLMASGRESMAAFVADVERLFARLLTAPFITIAACNGHTFAAGAMLALCHDFRIMREDRGYFCLPEVDLGIPFTPGMDRLIKTRLPQTVAHEVMVTGHRYGGTEAAAKGIVTAAVPEHAVLPAALDRASDLASKAGPILGTIKSRLYDRLVQLLENSRGTAIP